MSEHGGGMTEVTRKQANVIAIEHTDRFVSLLVEEIERLPTRADMNLNHRDFWEALRRARGRFKNGEVPM